MLDTAPSSAAPTPRTMIILDVDLDLEDLDQWQAGVPAPLLVDPNGGGLNPNERAAARPPSAAIYPPAG